MTTTRQPAKKPVTRNQLLLGLMWLFAIVLFIAGAGLASHLSSDRAVCQIGIVAALAQKDCNAVNFWYYVADIWRCAPLIALAVNLWAVRNRLSRPKPGGRLGSSNIFSHTGQ
jgi:hypothetical protein